jgi:hypothetical protein
LMDESDLWQPKCVKYEYLVRGAPSGPVYRGAPTV